MSFPSSLVRLCAHIGLFGALFACGSIALAQVPSVSVISPEVRKLTEYDEYTGRFDAVNRVDIRARVSGYLAEIHFDEGQIVEKGDQLAVIDQRPFQIALDLANAQLGEVRAARDLAKLEADRARRLREDRAVSQEEVDQRQQDLIAANARVAAAQARVAEAQLSLEFSDVRAPLSGRVGRRLIDVGNLISGGDVQGSLITTIVQEDPLHFYFEVSEADFLRYTRLNESGARPTSRTNPNAISIRLLDETDFNHHGAMDFVDNELDVSTGTLQGRALVENPNGFLQPGVFGRLRLVGSGEYEAVLVPDGVIQFDQSRQYVLIVNSEETVERRFIEPGPIVDGLRVIRDGLAGTDRVIDKGFHRIRIGDRVEPNSDSESGAN